MKPLKAEDNLGFFLLKDGSYEAIDKISKEDLLYLVTAVLENEVVLEDYDENKIKNQAHRIIYKSIVEKLKSLQARKQEFLDESERLFLEDYEKYKAGAA